MSHCLLNMDIYEKYAINIDVQFSFTFNWNESVNLVFLFTNKMLAISNPEFSHDPADYDKQLCDNSSKRETL